METYTFLNSYYLVLTVFILFNGLAVSEEEVVNVQDSGT